VITATRDELDPETERRRLAAVRSLGLLDTPPEDRFNRIAELAQQLFGVPMVGINLIDQDFQYSKAAIGIDPVTPRELSFCSRTILANEQLLVPDARLDPQFSDNPGVTGDMNVRFYAGQPLSSDGQNVGALCIIGTEPRELTASERRMLELLGRWVENELALDQNNLQAREVQTRLLPRQAPAIAGVQVAASCIPARQVGGDFYDWQVIDDVLQVVLADVMGKGVVAAITAAAVRAVMRGSSPNDDLATAVSRTALSMQEDLDSAGTFITLFALRLDPGSGHISYVDAGHGLVLILSPTAGVRHLNAPGLPIGAVAEDTWEACSEVLGPDEMLVLLSDGVLDSFPDILTSLVEAETLAREDLSCQALVDRVVDRFASQSQLDDVTVVAIRRTA